MRLADNLNYSLALSFLIHLTLIAVAGITLKEHRSLFMAHTLSVRIITPSQGKAESTAPSRAVEKAPAAEKAPVKAVSKPVKTTVSKAAEQALEDKMRLLMAKKRIEDRVELRRKLDSIRDEIEKSQAADSAAKANPDSNANGPGRAVTLNEYEEIVHDQIQKEWFYPVQQTGQVIEVTVRIDMSGNIKVIGMGNTSGNTVAERSLMRAIIKASPVRKPPFEITDEIVLRFQL